MIDQAIWLNQWIPASVRWLVNGRKLHSCVWKWCRTNQRWWIWRLNGCRESTQSAWKKMDVLPSSWEKGWASKIDRIIMLNWCCCVLRSRHPTVHQNSNGKCFPKNGRQFCMVILFPRRVVCQSTQRCCFGLEYAVSTLFTWSNPLKITWILHDMGSSNKEVKMLTRSAASLLFIPFIMLKLMKQYYKYCYSLQSDRLFVFWSCFLIPCISSFIEQPWYVKQIVPNIDDSQHW